MSGGPILPSSIYLGGASGNLSATIYVPATNTNNAGAIEGIGVVASLASSAPAILQFNLPEAIPTGTAKVRALLWTTSTSTSQVAKLTISDGQTAAGSNIGATSLTTETQVTQTGFTSDAITENKITITTSPTANNILTVAATFNATGWTLASNSVWQFSLVWE